MKLLEIPIPLCDEHQHKGESFKVTTRYDWQYIVNPTQLGISYCRECNDTLTLPDLSGVNLSGTNLGSADLSGVNLSGANLRNAYLRGTNLSDADFIGANLGSADLGSANLRNANLGNAVACVRNGIDGISNVFDVYPSLEYAPTVDISGPHTGCDIPGEISVIDDDGVLRILYFNDSKDKKELFFVFGIKKDDGCIVLAILFLMFRIDQFIHLR